jgi:hypothetical protein
VTPRTQADVGGAAVRALLSGLVDYAGLFPPAGLDMAGAVERYANHHRGPRAWMLGRFVVPVARLTEFAVAEMRDKYRDGVSIPRLAAEYGVSTSTAGAALRGDTWTHVPGPVEMRSPTHWRWGH